MRRIRGAGLIALFGATACQFGPGRDDSVSFEPPTTGGDFGVAPTAPQVFDNRIPVAADTPPPPISGGTLIVTRDAQLAVAADPDRDQVSIVSIPQRTVLHTVLLKKGDQPGRLVDDGAGRVHVALRGTGELAAIDLASGQVLSRRAACGAPRGVAYEKETDQLHVACSGGELVSFMASGGDPVRTLHLDVDLRDVVSTPDGLVVSRFKSAQVLKVTGSGDVSGRFYTNPIVRRTDTTSTDQFNFGTPLQTPQLVEPAVAWRTLVAADGSVLMLHQYALSGSVIIDDPSSGGGGNQPAPTGTYGAPVGTCGGIVQSAVTTFSPSGAIQPGAPLLTTVLAVDAAVSPYSDYVIVAEAGTRDDTTGFGRSELPSVAGRLRLFTRQQMGGVDSGGGVACTTTTSTVDLPAQVTAVAFNTATTDAGLNGVWVIAQTREPASLVFLRDLVMSEPTTIALSGNSVYDTGHEIFHRDAGAGIACASCHAEGEEDGRVWHFDPIGPRRTQSIDVGLEGTAPFHWDGDMENFDKLVSEVFVHRMGGADQSEPRRKSLSGWVFGLTPRKPIIGSDDAAALRGKALFASSATGCATCHSGDKFTNNTSAEVGTTEKGHALQVPSLRGVGYRAPFLHDGRALTLADRFSAEGGGDAHGHTSQLTQAQLGDLVAYLNSI